MNLCTVGPTLCRQGSEVLTGASGRTTYHVKVKDCLVQVKTARDIGDPHGPTNALDTFVVGIRVFTSGRVKGPIQDVPAQTPTSEV